MNKLKLLNDIDNIIDKYIINVSWLMFGSKKLNGTTYYASYIIDNCNVMSAKNIPTLDLIKMLSIHKFIGSSETKLRSFININNINDADVNNANNATDITHNIEMAKKLVNILSLKRSSDYHYWTSVGWALKNISDTLFDTFIDFSKKDISKYNRMDCEKFWENCNSNFNGGLTIKSLYYWAKNDNLEEYNKLML